MHYAESDVSAHDEFKALMESWRGFDALVAGVDSAFVMPSNLPVVFTDCGTTNALYDPEQKAIFFCYELINDLVEDYRTFGMSDSAHAEAVWQTTFFILYHEIGHALIDILDLPVTGREEDAVDQLATLVLLESGENGRNAALTGAYWFERMSQRRGSDMSFWDEHSLNRQRYFNIICWVYGSDTLTHAGLLEDDWGLPAERAERCPAEFDRISRAWNALLAPHAQ